MIALLDSGVANRLAKLCGMFSSQHEGERASAAAMADKLVRAQGLTWPEVIAPNQTALALEEQIGVALANLDVLTDWEREFIHGINGRLQLSPKQADRLARIVRKVLAFRAAGGGTC
jgi:hypothetical protein